MRVCFDSTSSVIVFNLMWDKMTASEGSDFPSQAYRNSILSSTRKITEDTQMSFMSRLKICGKTSPS